MRIDNPRYIRTEDFSEETQQAASVLAAIINPFMQQVADLTDGRIDFDNLNFNLTTFEIQLNSNGQPIGTDQINLGKQGIRGILVVNALGGSVTSQPFISFSNPNNSVVQINKITGLPAGRWRITVLVL